MQLAFTQHVDLYRYWNARRQGRPMPARRDLDPAAIPALLPHLTLVDVVGKRFRYRLMGTQIVEDLGVEMTGTYVGSHVTPSAYAAQVCSVYEQVRDSALPIFTTGYYQTPSELIQAHSRLLLPLSGDGKTVDMILLTRVAQYDHPVTARSNWLGTANGRIMDVTVVGSAENLQALCRGWEKRYGIAGRT